MNIGESTKLISSRAIPTPPIIKVDQNLISDLSALQRYAIDVYQVSIGEVGIEFSEEFRELQEMLIAIYTTAKLLGYNAMIDKSKTSMRFNLGEVGLTTINLKENFNQTVLKIYINDSIKKPIMETYRSESHEKKLKILQKILERL